MSLMRSFLTVRALERGRACPAATVRHVHLADAPMVFIPLRLAGEAAAPLAAMIGTRREEPRLIVVPDPRNRDQRFTFMAELAEILLPYVRGFATRSEMAGTRTLQPRCFDAPQVLVPSAAGVEFVRLLGRSTRFRRTEGPHAVPAGVPALGQWLTFLYERAEFADSAMLLAMTTLLSQHWASGQSAAEDGNLAAQLAWIDPPAGLTGPEAALAAEDPLRSPPAGPDTDPAFDKRVLRPLIDEARVDGLRAALRGQLEPTWTDMWRAVDLLRALPEGASVESRWERDRTELAKYQARIEEGGLPQGRKDSAVAAAWRLAAMEGAQQTLAASRAFDDPLVMAEYRADGAAFLGEVVHVEADRKIIPPGGSRAVLRPLVQVRTGDPLRLGPGKKVLSPARPKQAARIVSVSGDLVVLQLDSGMSKGATIPAVGELICYSDLDPAGGPRPKLPPIGETPWTHGGPPPEYVPTDEDAQEAWQ